MPELQKVSPERIQALMARVEYVPTRILNTTTTVVHAFLDGRFSIASGQSACLNPEDYDEALGIKIATERCRAETENKLWEMEGYLQYMDVYGTSAHAD